jgi:peptidoglycan/LPS O-acetylase OafA/YrhL
VKERRQGVEPAKLQVINLVRTFSIFVVLGAHYVALLQFQHPSEQLGRLGEFFKNGPYGVSLFFVISGFLITRLIAQSPGGLARPGWRPFYVRRVARLFPLLAVIVAGGAVLLALNPVHSWAFDFCFRNAYARFGPLFWVSILSFTFNWYRIYGEETGNFGLHWDVLWSLAIEEQFYLFYPLLLKALGDGRKLAGVLVGVIVLGPLVRFEAYLHHPGNYLMGYTRSFGAFDQIAWGALLFLAWREWGKKISAQKNWCMGLAVAGSGMVAAVYLTTSVGDGLQRVYAPTLLALGLCFFLMGALHLKAFESPALAWLSRLGEASYGAYLLQALGLYLLDPVLEKLEPLFGFPLFILFMTLLAQGSYRLFEVPANRWVRKKAGSRF